MSETRCIVITGGTSGLGAGLARHFAAEGARVVILGRRERALDAMAVEHGVISLRVDVTERGEVERAMGAAAHDTGAIDVLINSAGILREITTATPLDEADEVFSQSVDVNLRGTFLACLCAAPHMRSPGGRIVNFSSTAALGGGRLPGLLAYAAAKAGVLGLTNALARELGPRGITVNAICAGLVADTQIFREESARRQAERLESYAAAAPVGRAGTLRDVIHAVDYLTAPAASFITGEWLHVNGGIQFGR